MRDYYIMFGKSWSPVPTPGTHIIFRKTLQDLTNPGRSSANADSRNGVWAYGEDYVETI